MALLLLLLLLEWKSEPSGRLNRRVNRALNCQAASSWRLLPSPPLPSLAWPVACPSKCYASAVATELNYNNQAPGIGAQGSGAEQSILRGCNGVASSKTDLPSQVYLWIPGCFGLPCRLTESSEIVCGKHRPQLPHAFITGIVSMSGRAVFRHSGEECVFQVPDTLKWPRGAARSSDTDGAPPVAAVADSGKEMR